VVCVCVCVCGGGGVVSKGRRQEWGVGVAQHSKTLQSRSHGREHNTHTTNSRIKFVLKHNTVATNNSSSSSSSSRSSRSNRHATAQKGWPGSGLAPPAFFFGGAGGVGGGGSGGGEVGERRQFCRCCIVGIVVGDPTSSILVGRLRTFLTATAGRVLFMMDKQIS